MDKIYAKAYYRVHLNWDWDYQDRDMRARWSKVKSWLFKRMQKRGQLEMLSEITRSLD